METRSRKRAKASTSSQQSPSIAKTSPTKKPRPSSSSPTSTSAAAAATNSTVAHSTVVTRSCCQKKLKPAPMDSHDSPARRRESGQSTKGFNTREQGRGKGKGKGKEKGKGKGKGKEKEKEKEKEVNESIVRDSYRELALEKKNMPALSNEERWDNDIASIETAVLQKPARKMEAGLDDMIPSLVLRDLLGHNPSVELDKILSELKMEGQEGKQVEALTQLCELLLIGSAHSLRCFSVHSFVPVLVGLLNKESNPNIMLLSTRALTHLCDVLPSSCGPLLQYGAVSCFTARLLTIEYMDLAEQSLQGIKKISEQYPSACLRAGALMAILSYLHFFCTGVQRVALSTAANMCKKIPYDAVDFVMEAVPLLTDLLDYNDSKVLDHAVVCLTHITEAFSSSPSKLDKLCNHGLVAKVVGVISMGNSRGGQPSLSTPMYTGLIRLLSICASGSTLGAKTLLFLGISTNLKDILSSTRQVSSISVSPALTRPPDQIFEIVNLADGLLPPLPKGTISPPEILTSVKGSSESMHRVNISGNPEDVVNAAKNVISAHVKLMCDHPELLEQFGMDLLPVLIQIFTSSVNSTVRHKCLSVISKLMYFSKPTMIQSLQCVTNISSFLASILAWKDPKILIPALQMAEILMEKLPETFSNIFIREGVYHAINMLILPDSSSASTSDKYNDFATGSSRSRRYSRRIGTQIQDYRNMGAHLGRSYPKHYAQGNVNPSTGALEFATSTSDHWVVLSNRAKVFKDKYFPSGPRETEVGGTDDFIHLKKLCMDLNANIENVKPKSKGKSKVSGSNPFSISVETEDHLNEIIYEMLNELIKGVSTFEFIHSGVVSTLLNYFSCGTFSKERVSNANLPKLRQKALRRFKSFLTVALLTCDTKRRNELPMTLLVQKLQSALSSLEQFPVVLSHSRSSTENARHSYGLSVLSQRIKVRLSRAHGDKSLRDYSMIIPIDPMTTLSNIDEFLWPKVKPNDCRQKVMESAGKSSTSPSGHCYSTRSKPSLAMKVNGRNEPKEGHINLSKGKGRPFVRSTTEDEPKGTQTRIAAGKRTASGKNSSERTKGYSSSERSSREIDDAWIIYNHTTSEVEDNDVLGDYSTATLQEKVYDVMLDNSLEDAIASSLFSRSNNKNASGMDVDSDDIRTIGSFNSMGFMKFDAAMAGHLGSTENQGFPRSGSSNESPKLIFSSGGKILNRHLTIYQAIQQQLVSDDGGNKSKGTLYTITYQKEDDHHDHPKLTRSSSVSKSRVDKQWRQMSLLDSILQGELPCDLEKTNYTYSILALLRVLEGLNQLVSRLRFQIVSDVFATEGNLSNFDIASTTCAKVPSEEFVNNKLTPKLTSQVQDCFALCSGSLPSWCTQLTKACPFLFPFEARTQYFYSTTFGLHRALHRLQQQGAEINSFTNEQEIHVVRLQRQKVRVSRDKILESCAKVMKYHSSQKTVLEVEYFDEVGSGLGPTLEFYTLLSHKFQKSALQMWRCDSSVDADGGFVQTNLGLFPRPWLPNDDSAKFKKVVDYFHLIGQVIAKALQDRRLLDLPLSEAFYKLVLGQELDLHDILSFDAEFGKILRELQLLVVRKKYIEADDTSDMKADGDLNFHGTPVEDLCFDFTLPGYPDYILKQGKEHTTVNINNLEDYISLVVDATVKYGITKQIDAFRAGFNKVFDITSLEIFSPGELDCLLCGHRELWESETLTDHIKFDHGYTGNSPAIVNFLEIMGEFSLEDQRAFCQFVTGAPKLPPGGLAGLRPKLTIVKKISSSTTLPSNGSVFSKLIDSDLPSVMTCANYLKLPPYSTKEIMKKKLLYAIKEGQGSFDLS